jgi:hypothetical protein
VVLLDSLSVHKVEGVLDPILGRGAFVWFLPCYLPDLNPIELRNCAEITCDQKTELHELSAKIIAYYFRTVPYVVKGEGGFEKA